MINQKFDPILKLIGGNQFGIKSGSVCLTLPDRQYNILTQQITIHKHCIVFNYYADDTLLYTGVASIYRLSSIFNRDVHLSLMPLMLSTRISLHFMHVAAI